MTISEPRLRTLLRQAEKAAVSGKRAAAEALYRQIIAEAPEAEAAWLGLVQVVNGSAEKTAVYNHVLQINPENEAAKAGLAQLQDGSAPAVGETVPKESPPEKLQVPEMEAKEVIPEPEPVLAEKTAVTNPNPNHDHAPIEAAEDDFDLVCYRHPNRETSLRCYNCGDPICIDCARKTPVGYSCPDCIRNLQKNYYTATLLDYIIAVIIVIPLSAVAAYFLRLIGFFTFFISPVVGTLIGRSVFWAVRRHRGRWLSHVVAGAVVVGAGIMILMFGFSLWTGVYAFMAAASAYYFVKV